MFKKQTGRKIDVVDFKKMNKCVECGYADNMKYGEKCETCKLLNRKRCSYCDGILKDKNIYYSYDHNDNLRHLESLKLSKKPIKEFLVYDKSYTKPYNEDICESCHLLQEDIRKNYRNIKCVCGAKLIPKKDKEEMVKYIGINGRFCHLCLEELEMLSEIDKKLQNKIII